MVGFAKGILISMLASVALIIFLNLAFFFPWYMSIIETTFEVSQIVANDNYVNNMYFETLDKKLRERPIFRKRNSTSELYIEAVHNNGKDAIERISNKPAELYYNIANEDYKPYVQRGNIVRVKIHAEYPLQITLWGKEVDVADIPMEFSIQTMTLKHYKDLEINDYR